MSGTLLAAVEQILGDMGWPVQTDAESGLVHGSFRGRNGSWRLVVLARERQRQVIVYSELDFRIPPDARAAAAEFVTRANWGLPTACFELDLDEGDVRLRTGVDAGAAAPTHESLRPVIELNLVTMDRYLPALEATLAGRRTPAEAIADAEA